MTKSSAARHSVPDGQLSLLDVRVCQNCGVPLPDTASKLKRFCGKHCYNQHVWVTSDRAALLRRAKAYRVANEARRQRQYVAERPARPCQYCGVEMPAGSRPNKRFCSRQCINAVYLRNSAPARRAAVQRRRARLHQVGGEVSERDWRRLVNRFNGCCAYCGAQAKLDQDHVVPISRGGQNAIGNILPACKPCNTAKRDDFLVYWRLGRPQARLRPAI